MHGDADTLSFVNSIPCPQVPHWQAPARGLCGERHLAPVALAQWQGTEGTAP